MIRRTASIRGVGKPAHRIFVGTAIPPMLAGADVSDLISAAADAGFNAIDTARSYGGAEESIARWLKASPGNRDRIVLLTKCCAGRANVLPTAAATGADAVRFYVEYGRATPAGRAGTPPRGCSTGRFPSVPASRDASTTSA